MQARLILHAINPDQHIRRFFNITVGLNLFNEPTVIINRGRLGKGGQVHHFIFPNQQTLAQEVKKILKRRFHARGRLGVNYQAIEHSFDAEFEQIVWSTLKNKG